MEYGEVAFVGDVSESISRYYMSSYDSFDNEILGIYELQSHRDKKSKYGLSKAELFCNGKLSDTIYTGSKFELKLYFESSRDFFEGEIGIVIKDSDQISYIGINNKHIGNSIVVKEGEGKAEIVIEDFPLFALGDYWINLYFGDQGPNYESLENAIKFKIIGEDVFGSGRKLDFSWNKIVHKKITIETI